MSHQQRFIKALAGILLSGEWTTDAMTERVIWLLAEQPVWLASFIKHIHINFQPEVPHHSITSLVEFIAHDKQFISLWSKNHHQLKIRRYGLNPPVEIPVKLHCDQPRIKNTRELAQWLTIRPGQLQSYAAIWRPEQRSDNAVRDHYHYYWKTQGNGKKRLIEAPKSRLAEVQRQVYTGMLDAVPLHPACHGFRKRHSCYSYAEPHAGQTVVVKMDLQHFFMSIALPRMRAVFTRLGYSKPVAYQLAALCCNRTPRDIIQINPQLSWRARQLLYYPHLPQGSPCSPVISNIIAYQLDVRLAGFAEKMGASYTRYADDLAFSGGQDFVRVVDRLPAWVAFIAADEGFSINHRKTKLMKQGVRQALTGMTINCKPNSLRNDYERLKAILYNCIQKGPHSQNIYHHAHYRAHLQGRIAYIAGLNKNRGEKLQNLFRKINW